MTTTQNALAPRLKRPHIPGMLTTDAKRAGNRRYEERGRRPRHNMTLKLSPEERARLERAADAAGVSLSAFIRDAALAAIDPQTTQQQTHREQD